MNNTKRRKWQGKEKVEIIREYLLEQNPISDICEKYHLHPAMLRRWVKEFFEAGSVVFDNNGKKESAREKKRTMELEAKIRRQQSVIAEITQENVEMRKNWNGGV
jgi:transposase-like protein